MRVRRSARHSPVRLCLMLKSKMSTMERGHPENNFWELSELFPLEAFSSYDADSWQSYQLQSSSRSSYQTSSSGVFISMGSSNSSSKLGSKLIKLWRNITKNNNFRNTLSKKKLLYYSLTLWKVHDSLNLLFFFLKQVQRDQRLSCRSALPILKVTMYSLQHYIKLKICVTIKGTYKFKGKIRKNSFTI